MKYEEGEVFPVPETTRDLLPYTFDSMHAHGGRLKTNLAADVIISLANDLEKDHKENLSKVLSVNDINVLTLPSIKDFESRVGLPVFDLYEPVVDEEDLTRTAQVFSFYLALVRGSIKVVEPDLYVVAAQDYFFKRAMQRGHNYIQTYQSVLPEEQLITPFVQDLLTSRVDGDFVDYSEEIGGAISQQFESIRPLIVVAWHELQQSDSDGYTQFVAPYFISAAEQRIDTYLQNPENHLVDPSKINLKSAFPSSQ